MRRCFNYILLALSLISMSSCIYESDYTELEDRKVTISDLILEKAEVQSITKEEFENSVGDTITIEGIAVNAKPHSYIYVDFHIYIPTHNEFFWPTYLEGKLVKVTGIPVVERPTGREYARIDLAPKKYFLKAISFSRD